MDRYLDELIGRSLPEGGFASYEGGEYRPAASAWAALALRFHHARGDLVEKARSRLVEDQQRDGRVSVSSSHPSAYWPTAVAVLAWQGGALAHREAQERAVRFLLETSGLHWKNRSSEYIGHDTSIRGWPWVEGTHSWVEPTALAVMALAVVGRRDHERVREGLHMLQDRQLPSGGWNYGNTVTFGQELLPMVDATGMALTALAERTPRETVERSLQYLRRETRRLRTPLSLGWGLLGLKAWNEEPPESMDWIRETLEKQQTAGPFETSLLSLLLLTSALANGLIKALKGTESIARQGADS
ncbi:MAG: terpene cyclase/mutase family protein [Deltaproteobacteria bacterium]|nr:terpene cyclase/mutase family protein [Deltaproteobacteria bacterium]